MRRDIQVAIVFLCTRVKQPDQDDSGELKQVLKYLKGTKHMKLILRVDLLSIIYCWVDASYTNYAD